MPKKHPRPLPATRQVTETLFAAPPKPGQAATVDRTRTLDGAVACGSLDALQESAKTCRRCPLFACATQTVFGEGPVRAHAIIVGEQPGDQEDLTGRPFIGPSGMLLMRVLEGLGQSREELYLTNAVKHFKNESRGKRRLHKTPTAGEIDICRWWLEEELKVIEAPVIITLGASALRGVTGNAFKGTSLSSLRGVTLETAGRKLIPTVHPSYLLRLRDPDDRARETRRFETDLARAFS